MWQHSRVAGHEADLHRPILCRFERVVGILRIVVAFGKQSR